MPAESVNPSASPVPAGGRSVAPASPTTVPGGFDPLPGGTDEARRRLAEVTALMRDISTYTDPNEMVKAYGRRLRTLWEADGIISLSRRDLSYPMLRITRFSQWGENQPDPWRQRDSLPLIRGGVLADLLYAGQPRVINDFRPDPSDPAYEFIKGFHAINVVPHYDAGESLNMVVQYFESPERRFDLDRFPDAFWLSNLVGRGVNNMVLGRRLRDAYDEIDRELKVVGDIQQSLLPQRLPVVPGLHLATYYQTSRRAGGDYYDFFDLKDGRLGIFLADVSGHGTPAAVLMAVLHALAHQFPGPPEAPSKVLEYINRELASRYTDGGTFVTAFYGVYEPGTRTLHYANAGHNPPLVLRAGRESFESLSGTGLPLGILADGGYELDRVTLAPGDRLCLYTDGITETRGLSRGAMFGEEALAAALRRGVGTPAEVLGQVLDELATYSAGAAAADDRTVILAQAV